MNYIACPYCGGELEEDFLYCPHCESPLFEGRVPEPEDGFSYEVFISYRHLPNDQEMAKRIQRAIENKPIPRQVREAAGRNKFGKIFRDEDELPTSASLSDQINHALRHSRFLFVLCSPETPKSRWVCHEVEQFMAVRGREYVIPVLIEGEPADSFPPALLKRSVLTSDGRVGYIHAEPLAADMRNVNRKQFATEIQRLMAPLLGVGFDDLRQRFKLQRQRRIAFLATAVAAFSLVFGGFSISQQIQISKQLKETQIKESTVLANESAAQSSEGNRLAAIESALLALPASSGSGDRPFVASAQTALSDALGAYPSGKAFSCLYEYKGDVDAVSSSGGWFASLEQAENGESSRITIRSIFDGSVLSRVSIGEAFSVELYALDDRLFCASSSECWCFDAKTGDTIWNEQFVDTIGGLNDIAVSADKKHFAGTIRTTVDGDERNVFCVYSMETGKRERKAFSLSNDPSTLGKYKALAVNDDATKIAFASGGSLYLHTKGAKKPHRAELAHDNHYGIEFTPNGVVVASFHVNNSFIDSSEIAKKEDSQVLYSIECFDEKASFQWGVDGKASQVASLNNRAHTVYQTGFPRFCGQAKCGSKNYLAVVAGPVMQVLDLANGRIVDQADYGLSFVEGCNILINDKGECVVYVGVDPLGIDVRNVPRKDMKVVRPYKMSSNCTASWVGYVDGQLFALMSHFGVGSFMGDAYTSVFVKGGVAMPDASYETIVDKSEISLHQKRSWNADRSLVESHPISTDLTTELDKYVWVMDASTFELRNKIDLSKFTNKASDIAFSNADPNVLVISSASDGKLVYVDALTGEMIAELDVADWESSAWRTGHNGCFTCEYGTVSALVRCDLQNNFLVTYDSRTLEETGRIQVPKALTYVKSSWVGEGRLLAYGSKQEGAGFVLYDTSTGQLIEGDISSESVDVKDDDVWAFPKEDLVFAKIEDALHAFRLSTGERVGKIPVASNIKALDLSSDYPDDVFIQLSDLKVYRIDIKTADVKFESEPLAAKLNAMYVSKQGERLYGRSVKADGIPALAVVSLQDEQPGVVDYVSYGEEISSDAKTVLCESNSGEYYKVPCYSMDELIQMGKSELDKYRGAKE